MCYISDTVSFAKVTTYAPRYNRTFSDVHGKYRGAIFVKVHMNHPFTMLPKYIEIRRDISPYEKLVLLRIMDHMRKGTKISFPSMDCISFETGIPKRTVVTAIKKLEQKGVIFIRRERHYNKYAIIEGEGTLTDRWKREYTSFRDHEASRKVE